MSVTFVPWKLDGRSVQIEMTASEMEWYETLYRRIRELPEGAERSAAINEVSLVMNMKARFDATHRPDIPSRDEEPVPVRVENPAETLALMDDMERGGFKIPAKARAQMEDAAQMSLGEATLRNAEQAGDPLPDPDANRIGKFNAPDSGAPVTQRKAAIMVYPGTGTKRRGVLDAIARSDPRGMTDEDLYLALGWDENTIRPRRNELMNDGWVEDSNRTRRTPSGRDAVVWVLTEQGRAQWRPGEADAAAS